MGLKYGKLSIPGHLAHSQGVNEFIILVAGLGFFPEQVALVRALLEHLASIQADPKL